jgi:hypothetical protein
MKLMFGALALGNDGKQERLSATLAASAAANGASIAAAALPGNVRRTA